VESVRSTILGAVLKFAGQTEENKDICVQSTQAGTAQSEQCLG